MGTPLTHINVSGDIPAGKQWVGMAIKQLNRVKQVFAPAGLMIIGPKTYSPVPGVTITVWSLDGVRDQISIHVEAPAIELVPENDVIISEDIVLFWGVGYEVISFSYYEDSEIFVPGEAVFCTRGAGTVDIVMGSRLLGNYSRCFEGDGEVVGEESSAKGEILSCESRVYSLTYNKFRVDSKFQLEPYKPEIESPVDFRTISCQMNSKDKGSEVWTKTLGPLTVTAYEFSILAEPGYNLMTAWTLTAKWYGVQISFNGSNTAPFSILRQVVVESEVIRYQTLFDIWEEEGIYWISAAGLHRLRVCNFNSENFNGSIDIWSVHEYETPYDDRVGTVGLDKTAIFFNVVTPESASIITMEVVNTETGTHTIDDIYLPYEGDDIVGPEYVRIDTTVWNHHNDKLYVVYHEPAYQKIKITYDEPVFLMCSRWSVTAYFTCYYDENGGTAGCVGDICNDEGFDCATVYPVPGWESISGTHEGYEWEVDIAWPLLQNAGTINWNTRHEIHKRIQTTLQHGAISIAEVDRGGASSFASFDKGVLKSIRYTGIPLKNGEYDGGSAGLESLPDDSCENTENSYSLLKLGAIPGGVAYEFSSHTENWGNEPGVSDHECDFFLSESEGSEEGGGKFKDVAEAVAPYDRNWECTLKSPATDGDGEEVSAPVSVYKKDNEDSLLYGGVADGVLGPGTRAFFMKVRNIEEVEV